MSAKIIILKKSNPMVYQLKIVIKSVNPPIWRRIQISSDATLYTLHNTIQEAFGWTNTHLHDFAANNKYYGMIEEDIETAEGTLNEREYKIFDVLIQEGDQIVYTYDFGDSWRHIVTLEKILKLENDILYPVCITGKRACPVEDSGGAYGYMELLKAIVDIKHEMHEEYLEMVGDDYDPEYFNKDEINEILVEIAKNPNYVAGFGEEF